MKKLYYKYIITGFIATMIVPYGCKETFLEREPVGTLSESVLLNKAGVNGLLIGAYSLLDGVGANGTGDPYYSSSTNWVLSDVASDDSHKGSEYGDISDFQLIEAYKETPVTQPMNEKWVAIYAGVQRANDVLRVLAKVNGLISDAEATQIKAEAVFLRAVYHFEAAVIWKNVPYVDESITFSNGNYNITNSTPIWPKIETDLKFALDNLTETKSDVGRANRWAAKAFLAKAYMFQHKFAEAKPLLADIITNGVTSLGQKYALADNFSDNFHPLKQNNSEAVFAVQMTVNDNAPDGLNGRAGDLLNFASSGPANCCGFNQPSFSLVNSFKTDPAAGLPLLDTWNDGNITNDQGIPSTSPFTPYNGTLDPRLDYTAGRRGVPYLDWGLMGGASWIVSQSAMGPYIPVKNIFYQADKVTTSQSYQGWATSTSNNYDMIRFAEVLLWAAEVEVENGSLSQAEMYVNQVRQRAANPNGWVHTYIDNNDPLKGFTNTPAANYKIGLYSGQFKLQGQDYARKAVRFERKIELAMEGHRFFDLQRYDNGTGYMADVLNAYIQHETHIPGYNFEYMNGATFTKGKNEIYPIPQDQLDLSRQNGAPTLIQNPGY